MSQQPDTPADVWGNLACCYFMLGMYTEADSAAEKGETQEYWVNLLERVCQYVAMFYDCGL